jgi:hypothetical protein
MTIATKISAFAIGPVKAVIMASAVAVHGSACAISAKLEVKNNPRRKSQERGTKVFISKNPLVVEFQNCGELGCLVQTSRRFSLAFFAALLLTPKVRRVPMIHQTAKNYKRFNKKFYYWPNFRLVMVLFRLTFISERQLRAARGWLGWNQMRLARMAKLSLGTIVKLEAKNGTSGGRTETLRKVVTALEDGDENGGVGFIPDGIIGIKAKRRSR